MAGTDYMGFNTTQAKTLEALLAELAARIAALEAAP